MRVAAWAQALAGHASLPEGLVAPGGRATWTSLAAEAAPFLLAHRLFQLPGKAILVTADHDRALHWQAKLVLCGYDEGRIRQLPSGLSALFEDAAPETIAISDRIGALRYLIEPGPGLVIAPVQAALERTLSREVLEEAFLELRSELEIPLERVIKTLTLLGYERAEPVRIPGQFARRGGILDVYGAGRNLPVRIEFEGNTIVSMREFDPHSQRSVHNLQRVTLAPSRETIYPQGDPHWDEMLLRAAHQEGAHLPPPASQHLAEIIESDAQCLMQKAYFDRLDLYRPLLNPDSGCACDLVGPEGLLVLDEPLELEAVGSRSFEELDSALGHRAARGEILASPAHDFMFPPEHLGMAPRTLALTAMNGLPNWLDAGEQREIGAASLEPYRGRATGLGQALTEWVRKGLTVVIATDQPTRARAMLEHADLYPQPTPDDLPAGGGRPGLFVADGNLAGGFSLPAARFVLVSDRELFGVGRLRLPQKRFHEGVPIATVLDLKEGDYVVHIQYGIGVFRGLVTQKVAGVDKECLLIEYAAPDRLFVPADQLDRVQKYLNPGDTHPKLNRLTGTDWQKTIARAREEARAMARDLVQLYARRHTVQRAPYGPDSPWQIEMESTFPWVETPSQITAIRDVKRDLNAGVPMDRLVCGDVGFGKTEVAIRAAFKAAEAGRQVAVLCPTTILSEQHYRSFTERLAGFPTKVALLNRFRTAAEKKQIAEGLRNGDIDIVIGTHALLNDQLKFRNLGLVVIDEEQKFGVRQKERFKKLRSEVDVLSLSATPIPRTLSMALMDIRQMSLINDPPPGRLPIRTFVRPYSDEVVREALLRELARNGQVYYVYNRVQGLEHVAERVRKLAPHARIGVAHGQMTEAQLEPVMLAFIAGELDILVSTTIVESGLDIPNVNTLIVENADRFGLSQLYQLRGRVGRSDRQAYAYLLYRKGGELSDHALARLQALQEFSTLGSGYSLAFRDLQIRGAGELLGARQHGAMANVGYELYTQLIQEEVQRLKTSGSPGAEDAEEVVAREPLPAFTLPVKALIPKEYVRDQGQRLHAYMLIMNAHDPERLREARGDIVDRYGTPPQEVENSFEVMRLRMKAADLQIEKIDGTGGRLSVTFRPCARHSPRVFSLLGARRPTAYLSQDRLIWPFTGDALIACREMLEALEECVREAAAERASVAGA